ncbi:MAG: pseudouridine synthase [Desulfobulbaceae bacterium]|nr:pseudouridine synthase [Desulfobulbaceae bacterium]
MPPPIEILFQNDNLVVVNKPANMLVHRSRLSNDSCFLLQLLRRQLGRMVFPAHRLDRPTSGLMVFGLNKGTVSRLGIAFQECQVEKSYLAVVRGWLHEEGVIDYPLKKEGEGVEQEAISYYEPLECIDFPWPVAGFPTARYTLLRITPKTGRWHQLRRHLAHIRHPIVGDTGHGDGKHNRLFREHFNIHRLMLHASTLSFTEPETGEALTFTLQPDWSFQTLFPTSFEGNNVN